MSVLLSAVGPIAVRLQVRALQRVGRTAGRTFAISTAGSIVGTFVTAFWLIPEFGDRAALRARRGGALRDGGARRRSRAGCAPVVAVALRARPSPRALYAVSLGSQHIEPLTATSAQNWSPLYRTRGYGYLDARDPRAVVEAKGLKVVFAEDTRYHRLAVVDDEDTRYLRFDNSLQSAMYLDDPFRTRYRYTDLFHLGIAYNPDARNVLFVGLGAGSSEKRMWRDFPRLQLAGGRARPGRRRRRLPLLRRCRATRGCAGRRRRRPALPRGDERRWDVIVVDAFFADAIPAHLVTQEFLALVRSRLAPGGVVVTNAIGAIAGPGLAALPLDLQDLPHGVPVRARAPGDPPRRRGRRAVPEPDPGRDREGGARPAQLADRWDELRARDAARARPRASRSSTAATA